MAKTSSADTSSSCGATTISFGRTARCGSGARPGRQRCRAGLVNKRLAWSDVFTACGLPLRVVVALVHVAVTASCTENGSVRNRPPNVRLESAYNGRMTASTLPLQLLLLTVSGWVHRHQQDVIAYLVEENRVLKEQLRGRKLRLTDDQRRRLAVKAKCLGRRALDAVATLVTPDTLMRWHRRLIAWKWTYAARRVGRPGVRKVIAALIVRLARENDRWGYCRIQGELRKLGHRVAASTIGKVLKDHGIRPAPDRPTSWRTFLRAHWGEVAGMDFFTTEVWTPLGLTTYYILFLIDLKTRRAHIAGLTTTPDGAFIAQVARNLKAPS